MAKNITTEQSPRITPEDLRDKLQGLQGDVKSKVDNQKMSIASVAAGAGVVLLIVFFLLGKRSGRKKSAIVEIRRV